MPWLVAIIIQALVWVFRSRIGLFILSALAWLGLTYGTQKVVVQPAIEALQGYLTGMGSSSGLGAAAFAWVGVLKFDVACTMMISAITTKLGVGAAKVVLMRKVV
jgi:hypothetical protein